MVDELGHNTVTVNWSAPAFPNGILFHYNIYLERETEEGFVMVFMQKVAALDGADFYSAMFENLTSFTLYRVRVTAETRIGEGESEDVFVTTDPSSSLPPTNFNVETLNSTAIRVSWSFPDTPNGNITGYTIFTNAREGGRVNITLSSPNDMSDQMYVFDGLMPFTNYQFRVAAFAETPEETHFGFPTSEITVRTNEDRKTCLYFLYYY